MHDSSQLCLRVMIPESIPTRNRGEAAILEGIREAVSFCGEYELTVYSSPNQIEDDMAYARGEYQVVGGLNLFGEASSRTRFYGRWAILLLFCLVHRVSPKLASALFKNPLLRAIGKADMVIAGHDGMLNQNHFYLAVSCRVARKPLVLYGGSHGMQGRVRLRKRKYLQYLIKSAALCTVRDQRAKDFFTENDVPADSVHVFPDPAVMLEASDAERTREILQGEGVPVLEDVPLYALIPALGGIVAQTSFSVTDSMEEKQQLRVELWADIVRHLLETTNAYFVFLPHCTGPTPANDDRIMNRAIYQAVTVGRDRLTAIETPYRACELKGIMSLCDFVLAERTHALIGAVSVATPCLALTTEEDLRMHAIIRDQFERVTYNLNYPDIRQLEDLLAAEWEKRDEIRRAMTRKAVAIHERAEEAAKLLRQSVSNVLRKRGTERHRCDEREAQA